MNLNTESHGSVNLNAKSHTSVNLGREVTIEWI
jgi:hypothetical protein